MTNKETLDLCEALGIGVNNTTLAVAGLANGDVVAGGVFTQAGGVPLWQDEAWRVIRAEEAGFPAFYRVIWNDHAAEFSDLSTPERQHCMDAVVVVEYCGYSGSTTISSMPSARRAATVAVIDGLP